MDSEIERGEDTPSISLAREIIKLSGSKPTPQEVATIAAAVISLGGSAPQEAGLLAYLVTTSLEAIPPETNLQLTDLTTKARRQALHGLTGLVLTEISQASGVIRHNALEGAAPIDAAKIPMQGPAKNHPLAQIVYRHRVAAIAAKAIPRR